MKRNDLLACHSPLPDKAVGKSIFRVAHELNSGVTAYIGGTNGDAGLWGDAFAYENQADTVMASADPPPWFDAEYTFDFIELETGDDQVHLVIEVTWS